MVRIFTPNVNPAKAYRVETVEPMSRADALALMRELGSPYEENYP